MKKVKILMLLAATIMLANCSSHYNIKKETGGNVVSKVPNWYMNDFNEKKACKTSTFGKDKDRVFSLNSWFSSSRNNSDLAKATGEEINEITSEDFPRMTLIFGLSLFNNNTLENDKAIINKKWSLYLTTKR